MTSLSNYPQDTGRVIQIKKVNPVPHPSEEEYSSENLENHKDSLQQDIHHLQTRKQELIQQTAAEIEAMKQTWEEERKVIENESFRKGFEEGTSKGQEEGRQVYESRIEQANLVVEKAGILQKEKVKESERMILDLALTCAEKIVKKQLMEQPEAFLPLVSAAIEEVQAQPEVTIYVHPDQFGLLQEQREELHEAVRHNTDLSIYVEAELPPFTCRVESPFGIIDAGIDTQLTELRKAVLKAAERADADE